MRLLIECTYVYDHPYFNSGIQRVVRNIIRAIEQADKELDCIPVILKNGTVYEVTKLQPERDDRLLLGLVRLEDFLKRYWYFHSLLEKRWPFSASRNLRRALFVLAKILGFFLQFPMRMVQERLSRHIDRDRARKLQYRKDDVLVLLDSSWHSNSFAIVEKLKAEGLPIVSVIYDLIPITHPQFCDDGLVAVFNQWFDWIARTADGFIAISSTISAQVKETAIARLGEKAAALRWYDFFNLGSELDLTVVGDVVRERVQDIFARPQPIYLMVSTIEPRKNHAYLLDAFDRLWRCDVDVRLCIVGRIGWKCNELIERVETHAEFGKRLLMLNDLSDLELEYCYEHAKALVFPSFVEGFGLPVVEAMQRGLPVMTSDIPVFREVGGDFAAYFDLARPESLAEMIAAFEQTGRFPAARNLGEWSWLNWDGAAQMLVAKVRQHSAAAASLRPRHRLSAAAAGGGAAG